MIPVRGREFGAGTVLSRKIIAFKKYYTMVEGVIWKIHRCESMLPNTNVQSLVVSKGTIFAGTAGSGVVRYTVKLRAGADTYVRGVSVIR
jgi:hypothetical protein